MQALTLPNNSLPLSLSAVLAEMPDAERMEMQSAWQLSESVASVPFDTKQAGANIWANLEAMMEAESVEVPIPSFSVHQNTVQNTVHQETQRPALRLVKSAKIYYRMGIAASIVAVVGVGYLFTKSSETPAYFQTRADVAQLVGLPDGSKVDLVKGASLSFTEENGVRKAHLAGEGFFEVNHNGKPFVLQTLNAEVKVLGTRFRVKAYMHNGTPETVVKLESGKVALYAQGKPALYLEPGQTAEVAGNRATLMDAPKAANMPLSFNDETLSTIVHVLEDRFGQNIQLASNDMGSEKLSLYFKDTTDLESVLNDICAYQNYKIQKLSDGFLLKRR